MTGGSLGLRTGSYGSLLQQQQVQSSVVLPVQCTPGSVRKVSKMLGPPGSREKFLPWICKVAGRRKVGMLLLAVISILVFLSILSVFSKDEDASEGPDINWNSRPLLNTRTQFPYVPQSHSIPEKDNENKNASSTFPKLTVTDENMPLDFHPVINTSRFPSRHPCESFAYPPPPADRKRTGPRPCEVCYVPVEHALALMPTLPSPSPVLRNLTYFSEETSYMNVSNGGSAFGGHPSLQQRNESFNIKDSMIVHCGFFRGSRPGSGSGFDIDETDLHDMEKCRGVVVASAIFGNYDIIQQPKNISEITKRHACFYMFVDEETEAYMRNTSNLDETRRVGLWKIVVVHNLPYADARRNGKIPKLLLHRLFPNARFSLWIDGKLELVVDPYQLLERFLWRKNATFAISRHYRRFDVFEEAEANKAAGKYDNASIDFQIDFYKNEGLTHYSEDKLPITSDVPEGCVIIKEHTPITNLFTCLWFNEVDRFTSRDQLSFSTVRDRIMSKVNWTIDMFWDCERRNFVVQAYHKDLLDHLKQQPVHPPPLLATDEVARKPQPGIILETTAAKKAPVKHGKERRSGSRRRRSRSGTARDSNFI